MSRCICPRMAGPNPRLRAGWQANRKLWFVRRIGTDKRARVKESPGHGPKLPKNAYGALKDLLRAIANARFQVHGSLE